MTKVEFTEEYVEELKQLLKTDKATVLYPNALYEVEGKTLISLLKSATDVDYEYWYMNADHVKMTEFRV